MVPGATMSEVDLAGRRVMLERLQQMGLVSKGASMDALIDARVGARLEAGNLYSSWGCLFAWNVLLVLSWCGCRFGVTLPLSGALDKEGEWLAPARCAMGQDVTI